MPLSPQPSPRGSRLSRWLTSPRGQLLLHRSYSWGAALVILGALFKILELPYADQLLLVSMLTECLIFILSGFDISTTTLPKDRLHKSGGLYERKVNDGYEVLEIAKGLWTEAIFAKEKPELEPLQELPDAPDKDDSLEDTLADEGEDLPEEEDFKVEEEEEDDTFDDDKLTEESYRTTYDTDPEDLNYEAEEISDENDY